MCVLHWKQHLGVMARKKCRGFRGLKARSTPYYKYVLTLNQLLWTRMADRNPDLTWSWNVNLLQIRFVLNAWFRKVRSTKHPVPNFLQNVRILGRIRSISPSIRHRIWKYGWTISYPSAEPFICWNLCERAEYKIDPSLPPEKNIGLYWLYLVR